MRRLRRSRRISLARPVRAGERARQADRDQPQHQYQAGGCRASSGGCARSHQEESGSVLSMNRRMKLILAAGIAVPRRRRRRRRLRDAPGCFRVAPRTGKVGEQADGYLGVVGSADAVASRAGRRSTSSAALITPISPPSAAPRSRKSPPPPPARSSPKRGRPANITAAPTASGASAPAADGRFRCPECCEIAAAAQQRC
jgi:hypothetical protein